MDEVTAADRARHPDRSFAWRARCARIRPPRLVLDACPGARQSLLLAAAAALPGPQDLQPPSLQRDPFGESPGEVVPLLRRSLERRSGPQRRSIARPA